MADSREFQKLVESINEDRERNRKLNEGVGELVDIQKKIFKKQEEQAKRADRAEKEAERLRKLEEARNQELSKSTKTGAVAGGAGGSGALFAKLAALLLVADKIIEGFQNTNKQIQDDLASAKRRGPLGLILFGLNPKRIGQAASLVDRILDAREERAKTEEAIARQEKEIAAEEFRLRRLGVTILDRKQRAAARAESGRLLKDIKKEVSTGGRFRGVADKRLEEVARNALSARGQPATPEAIQGEILEIKRSSGFQLTEKETRQLITSQVMSLAKTGKSELVKRIGVEAAIEKRFQKAAEKGFATKKQLFTRGEIIDELVRIDRERFERAEKERPIREAARKTKAESLGIEFLTKEQRRQASQEVQALKKRISAGEKIPLEEINRVLSKEAAGSLERPSSEQLRLRRIAIKSGAGVKLTEKEFRDIRLEAFKRRKEFGDEETVGEFQARLERSVAAKKTLGKFADQPISIILTEQKKISESLARADAAINKAKMKRKEQEASVGVGDRGQFLPVPAQPQEAGRGGPRQDLMNFETGHGLSTQANMTSK